MARARKRFVSGDRGNSRGQAALEFLTTYGWAVLVILVMIGAISYFGIMRPSKVLPSHCTTASEFSCKDYIIQDEQLKVTLNQGIGKTIYVETFVCALDGVSGTVITMNGAAIADTAWSPVAPANFTCGNFNVLNGLRGQKVRMTYNLQYRQSTTGFVHEAAGELYTEVQ